MLLKEWYSDFPISFDGEGAISSRSFIVGGTAGAATVTEIEDTGYAIIVRRSGDFSDVLIRGTGNGKLLEKTHPELKEAKPTVVPQQQGGKRG